MSMATETLKGVKQGLLIGVALLALVLPSIEAYRADKAPASEAPVAAASSRRAADFGAQTASNDARLVADWVVGSRNNAGLPFAMLDKRDARLFVFDASGRLIGASAVLLGAAPGDFSVVGIGKRPIADIRPEERTTPAGRFVSRPGRNAGGEDVIWIDYDAALSMHRLRAIEPKERRQERLATPTPDDNRISYGCVNVPASFYDTVVKPVLGAAPAVVYVLPETRSVREVFATI
jgi:hypothetical protein